MLVGRGLSRNSCPGRSPYCFPTGRNPYDVRSAHRLTPYPTTTSRHRGPCTTRPDPLDRIRDRRAMNQTLFIISLFQKTKFYFFITIQKHLS